MSKFATSNSQIAIFWQDIHIHFFSAEVQKISLKTLDASGAAMTDDEKRGFQVLIRNDQGEECETGMMNNPGRTNFQRGKVDVFEDSALGACSNFKVPGNVRNGIFSIFLANWCRCNKAIFKKKSMILNYLFAESDVCKGNVQGPDRVRPCS